MMVHFVFLQRKATGLGILAPSAVRITRPQFPGHNTNLVPSPLCITTDFSPAIPEIWKLADPGVHNLEHPENEGVVRIMELVAVLVGFLGGALLFGVGIAAVILILMIVANLFLFRKMGLPGWYGIIPIWNTYNLFRQCWTPLPWFGLWVALVALGILGIDGIIGLVVSVLALAVSVVLNYKLALSFGKGVGYCIGLSLVPVVFLPMLAFGHSLYQGNPSEMY